ncbi:MAG: hypothetical protein QXM61_06745 [Archaeoglobaceae archaeon]
MNWKKIFKRENKTFVVDFKPITYDDFENVDPNDSVLREPWITGFFAIIWHIEKSDAMNYALMDSYFNEFHRKLLEFLLFPTAGIDAIGKVLAVTTIHIDDLPEEYRIVLQDYANPHKVTYFTLIRFPDLEKPLENNIALYYRFVNLKEEKYKNRNYKLTPIQFINLNNVCRKIEETLFVIFQCKPHQNMTRYVLTPSINDDLIIWQFDGVQFISHPFSRMIELYAKYPKIFFKTFGIDFEEFIKWTLEKENDSDYMKKCVEITKNLLDRYGVPY